MRQLAQLLASLQTGLGNSSGAAYLIKLAIQLPEVLLSQLLHGPRLPTAAVAARHTQGCPAPLREECSQGRQVGRCRLGASSIACSDVAVVALLKLLQLVIRGRLACRP